MAGRLSRSVQLFRASWGVLRGAKGLVVFPVVSAVAGLCVIALFAVPVIVGFVDVQTTHDGFGGETSSWSVRPGGWALMAVGYVVVMYVGTFMNAALIVAANERLTGSGPGTVSSGLRGACAKAGALAGWVAVAATVGLVLRALEERFGLIGRLVIGLVGIAWSLLTFLIVPVLVLEEHSTGGSISRSVSLFEGTWGENVIGNAGLGLFGLAVVAVAVVAVLIAMATGSTVAIVAMVALAVLWVLVASQVLAAIGGIYRVALYRYAVDGTAPAAYAAFDFDGAFRAKRTSGLFSGRGSRRGPAVTTWKPPVTEPIQGEYGIEIPGVESLSGHEPDRHDRPPD